MRVLVVDDSAFMRKVITEMINSDPQLNVIGTAINGLDALEKIPKLRPDVLTLDVIMPRMDGLTTLKHIIKQHPLPVIMLSSATQKGTQETFEALKYGAIDYVPKPSGQISLDINKIKDELIAKIKTAMLAKIGRHKQIPFSPIQYAHKLKEKIITIGASTGGPPALENILSNLPENIPPILIVQHMPPVFTKFFADRLDQLCKFEVKEAEDGDLIVPGRALIAPGGFHLTVESDGRVCLNKKPPIHGVRPAVDPMMETAARVFRSETIGVILTGMGRDGAYGMKAIKRNGGRTIAQDEATCVVYGMPKAAVDEKCVDKILPLHKIPEQLLCWCRAWT